METRKLRNLKVPAIGYGCMGLSHGYGSVPEHIESIRLIRQASVLYRSVLLPVDFYPANTRQIEHTPVTKYVELSPGSAKKMSWQTADFGFNYQFC
jgi:hypothetical protein